MKTIGIIGFGSMGSMLAEALLRNDVVEPRAICLYSRTAERYAEFCTEHFEVVVARSITDLMAKSEIVFICVPPASVKPVLQEISESDVQDKAFVSFASSVTIDCLSSIVGRRVSRIVPNINAEVGEGLFLVCHGSGIDSESASRIEGLLSKIGVVYRIPESEIEIYTDLTSCSPGIFSSVFATFIESSLQFGKIDKDLATEMVIQSLYGVTKLYKENGV